MKIFTGKFRDNIVSLALLQGLNYLLPLFTIPYLVRVLEPDKFGIISFSQGLMQYFIILTDYGLNLTGTQLVSSNIDEKYKLSSIFSAVMYLKIILILISFIFVFILVESLNVLRCNRLIYYVLFAGVVGSAISPVWFFHGIQKNNYVFIINLFCKVLSLLFLLCFVKSTVDVIYAVVIISAESLTIGIIGVLFVFKLFGLKLMPPALNDIIKMLHDGWHVFVSTAAISLYTTSNIVVLGLFCGGDVVGYFSAAEKLVSAFKGIISPISQAAYPRINEILISSVDEAIAFIGNLAFIKCLISLMISVVLLFFAPTIVLIVLGSQYKESVDIVRIMSFLPFIIAVNNILGIQVMLNFGMKIEFYKIILSCGILNLILSVLLAINYGAYGVSASVVITEFLIAFVIAIVLYTKGFRFLPFRKLSRT